MRFVKALLAAGVLAAVVAPSAMAFRFDDSARNPPTGVTGQSYSHPLQTVAGCKGVAINVLSGSLPPGLSLSGSKRDDVDGSNWRIVGTPTVPGTYPFYLQATNICGDSTEEDFIIRVVAGLAIQQPTVPGGTVGVPYTYQLTAGGGGSHTWTVVSGTLPAGLTLAPNGVISGTPTAAVSAPVTVQVSDGGRSARQAYTFNVRNDLVLTAAPVPGALIDKMFRYSGLAVTGGSGVNTWTIASGAPPEGVNLDPATGVFSGIPIEAGNYALVVRVADNEGRAKEARVVIQVASPIEILTKTLAAFRVGRIYSLAIRTEGGVGIPRYGRDTFNWRVIRGRLPIGLRLNTRVGKLIGRPRHAGTYRVTFRVSDKFGSTDTQTLVIKVNKKR